MDFKPLDINQYPRPDLQVTEDNVYWKNLTFPCAFKEFGGVDFIDFSAELAAVTCSAKVQLYNTAESKLQSTFSRFKRTAYGGVFRKDGNLLVAGSEDGFLRLFDVQGNRMLRVFKGHKAATHRCNFTPSGVNIVSFSDDKTAAFWDIPTETKLRSFEGHKDYIRAGAVTSQDFFISGSYDHTVKLWDARTGGTVSTVDHGAPVESVIMFPSGGVFISAGGTSLKVWDPIAGRLLSEIVQHHKTVTSLCFASNGGRLMSGSLDRHIKIYNTTTYEVVHTLNYPSPILAVAVANDNQAVGVGMTDGLFSLRHMKKDKSAEEIKKKNTYETDFKPINVDIIVPGKKKKISKKYDTYLRKFDHRKALDAVLKNKIQDESPEITVEVLRELMRRNCIKGAMAGREGESLLPLFKFVTRYIGDVRFQGFLIDIAWILLELYGSKIRHPEIKKMIDYLNDAVNSEVELIKQHIKQEAILKMIKNSNRDENAEEPKLIIG